MKTDEDNMTRGAFWNLIFFSFNKMASNKSSPNLAPMIYIYIPTPKYCITDNSSKDSKRNGYVAVNHE